MSLRDKFIKRYSLNYKKYAKVQSLSQIISQLPKFVLEILFISICAIMLTTNFIDLSFQEKFPIIVAGAYKLVPIFSLMVQNVSRLIYGRKPLEEIIDRHSSLKKSKKLKIINKINDSKSKLITNFSALPSHSIKLNRKKVTEIHLEAFKVTVITGASGAGKTTLIDQLTSLKKEGVVTINENYLNYKNLFYVPQNPFLIEGTLLENLDFLNIKVDLKNLKNLLKQFSIGHLVERLLIDEVKLGNMQELSGISGGELKRLFLLFAYLSGKKIIFLDEPFSGLDNSNKFKMVKIINEYFNNFSLFIVTHEMVDLIRHDYLLEMKKNDNT